MPKYRVEYTLPDGDIPIAIRTIEAPNTYEAVNDARRASRGWDLLAVMRIDDAPAYFEKGTSNE